MKRNTQELTIKNRIPEDTLNDKAQNELNKIKDIEKTVDRENLVFRAINYTYSFKNFQKINFWQRHLLLLTGITLKESDGDQSNL